MEVRWNQQGVGVREKKYTSDVCDLEDGELLQLLGIHGSSGLIEPRTRSRRPECRIDSIQLCLDGLGKGLDQ